MSEKAKTTRALIAVLPVTLRELAAAELDLIEGGYLSPVGTFDKYQLPTIFDPKNGPTVPTVCFPQVYPR